MIRRSRRTTPGSVRDDSARSRHVWLRALSAMFMVVQMIPAQAAIPVAHASTQPLDLGVKIIATYDDASIADSGVGEASPDLPSAPTLPAASPMPGPSTRSGSSFTFSISCATVAACDTTPPTVAWDFGDGTTGTGMTESHRYTKPGVYTVEVSATRGDWVGHATRRVFVSASWGDLATVDTYASGVLSSSPAGYWRLGDDPGSTTASDSAGSGATGAATNVAFGQAGAIGGDENTSATFVPDSSVTVPSGLISGSGTPFSIEMWVKPNALPSSGNTSQILALSSTTFPIWVDLDSSGVLNVHTLLNTFDIASYGTVISPGSWTYVVFAFDGTSFRVYIDGSFVDGGTPVGTLYNLDGGMVLGTYLGQAGLDGQIDEVAIYASQLSAADVADHYQLSQKTRADHLRADRDAIWVVSALGLLPGCRIGTPASGASGLNLGRAEFCPEPSAPDGLTLPIAMPAAATSNGLTGESCLARPGACDLPADLFPSPATAANASTITALQSGGYIDGSNKLIYDPANCGDGWVAKPDGGGGWTVVAGSEDGCGTRADWYRALVRALDGRVDRSPLLQAARLNDTSIVPSCSDLSNVPVSDVTAFKRAVGLGIGDVAAAGATPRCGFTDTITKGEAYRALGAAAGASVSGTCSATPFRDLYDMTLGTASRVENPDCVIIQKTLAHGVPLVGDTTCPDGTGVCFNPDETLTRSDLAVLLAELVNSAQPSRAASELALSSNSPRQVGDNIVVRADTYLPLDYTGTVSFTFGSAPANMTQSCVATQDVPAFMYGNARKATAFCTYVASAPGSGTVHVTATTSSETLAGDVTLTAIDLPPGLPSPTNMPTIAEGVGVANQNFTSVDPESGTLTFEVATSSSGPWVDPAGLTSGDYGTSVLADSPAGYWRFDETSGTTAVDSSGNGNNGTIAGTVTVGDTTLLTGDPGRSLGLSGSGSKVTLPTVNLLNGTSTGKTVEVWFKTGADVTTDQVVYFEGGSLRGLTIAIDDGYAIFTGWDLASEGSGTPWGPLHVRGNIEPNTIYHAVLVYDGTSITGYLNGADVGTVGGAGTLFGHGRAVVGAGNTPIWWDGTTHGYIDNFTGTVDELAIYNTVFTPTNVVDHYTQGIRRLVIDTTAGRPLGTLDIAAVNDSTSTVTLTPVTSDAHGSYNFWLHACDAGSCSPAVNVTGQVTPTNDDPYAMPLTGVADEAGPAQYFTLSGSDPVDVAWSSYTGAIAGYRITAGPSIGTLAYDSDNGAGVTWTDYSSGTVQFTNPQVRYTPGPGPSSDGTATFTYGVIDSGEPTPAHWSPDATVSITVNDVNLPPVCQDVSVAGTEDTGALVTFDCTDSDFDPLTYNIIAAPSAGSLSGGTGVSQTYTPNLNWCGTDTFTYQAVDPNPINTSNISTVTLNIACVNDAPTAPEVNLLTNSDFNAIKTVSEPWDQALNGTVGPNGGWSDGYNLGVPAPTTGYHAHVNTTAGPDGSDALEFIDENTAYGYPHRWLGVRQTVANNVGTELGWATGTQVTVEFDMKVDTTGKPVRVGLYHSNPGGSSTFSDDILYAYANSANTWEHKTLTFTLAGTDWDFTKRAQLYVYGHYGSEGRAWVDNFHLYASDVNLAPNGDFNSTHAVSLAWDEALNSTIAPDGGWWSSYISTVPAPTTGYHAHVNPTAGPDGSPAFEFIDQNTAYGYPHRYMATALPLANNTSTELGWSAGTQVTVEFDMKVNTTGKTVRVGLYHSNPGGSSTFSDDILYATANSANVWEHKTLTFTLAGTDWNFAQWARMYIYGHYGTEGRAWVDNVHVYSTVPHDMPPTSLNTASVGTLDTVDPDYLSGAPSNTWTFYVSPNGTSGWTSGSISITGGTVSLSQGVTSDQRATATFTPTTNWCGNYTYYTKVWDGSLWSPVSTIVGHVNC